MNFHWDLPFAAALTASIAVPSCAGAAHNAPVHAVLKTVPPPLASTSFTAVVNAKGKLVRGSATAASQPEGEGSYEVDFPNNVTQCAYVATIGEPGSTGAQPAGFITVVGRSGVSNGVFIETFDINGHQTNTAFHIDVGC